MRKLVPSLPIVLVYGFIATLYAIYTPPWQAPDEPAHYNYIRQLAAGRLPMIEPGDYDETYRSEIVSAGFAAPYSIEPLTYEDWQPPLYYLLQTPIFLLFDGALLPLRLFSALLGAGVVLMAYGVARQLWPARNWPALTATAFVAFLPQHVAMLTAINNDSLAELLIGALLWLLLALAGRAPEPPKGTSVRSWLFVGFLLGLGFLTKATVYIMVPVVALALLWQYRNGRDAILRAASLTFLPALLLGALWWGRNLVVYGGLDILGKAAHDTVVVGQLRTAEWIAREGVLPAAGSFLRTTFQSFWGQFGWMGVVMPSWVYQILLFFTLLILAGFLWTVRQQLITHDNQSLLTNHRLQATILAATFALSLLLYLGYNVTFVQHQGRYLFPALIPIAIAVTVGIAAWIRPLIRERPWLATAAPAGLALALAGLDLLALFRFIVPGLT